MDTHEHETGKLELFLILALPFIGTAVAIALSCWLYHLDIPTRM